MKKFLIISALMTVSPFLSLHACAEHHKGEAAREGVQINNSRAAVLDVKSNKSECCMKSKKTDNDSKGQCSMKKSDACCEQISKDKK